MESLLLLACPLGMGAMMWLMMRGGQSAGSQPAPQASAEQEHELARLRAEVEALKAQPTDAQH